AHEPEVGPPGERPRRAAAVADDRLAHAQRVDLTEDRRRRARRGYVPSPPGTVGKREGEPRAPATPRSVDEELPPRRAVRRRGSPAPGTRRAGTERRPSHGRQSARQWRKAAGGSRPAGLHRLRDPRAPSRRRTPRVDAPAR